MSNADMTAYLRRQNKAAHPYISKKVHVVEHVHVAPVVVGETDRAPMEDEEIVESSDSDEYWTHRELEEGE